MWSWLDEQRWSLGSGDRDKQRRDVTEFRISFGGQWPNHEGQLGLMRRENSDETQRC